MATQRGPLTDLAPRGRSGGGEYHLAAAELIALAAAGRKGDWRGGPASPGRGSDTVRVEPAHEHDARVSRSIVQVDLLPRRP